MSIKDGINNFGFVKDEIVDCSVIYKKDSENNIFFIENKFKFDDQNLGQNVDQNKRNALFRGKKITYRGYFLILALATTLFSGYSSYSLLAPFYPRVAERKQLTISDYVLVFSIYEIIKTVALPFCSKVALKITPKYLLILGLIIIAHCSITFGFLIYSRNGSTFLYLCLLVRCFWAIGGSTSTMSANLIGALLFPNHIPTVFSLMQVGAGLGTITGPFLGGYLFELFGYPVPFLATASLCIIAIIPIGFLVQNELKPKDANKKQKSTSIKKALKVPGVSINLFISFIISLCLGFNESTLDFHLREIDPNLSPSQSGQIFLITGVIYSVLTLICSRIAQKWSKSYYIVFLGCIMLLISMSFVGPVHGLPFEPRISYIIFSQVCFGFAMAPLYVLSYDDCFKQAKIHLKDNDSTISTITGIYTASYSLGVAIGPFIGGKLVQNFTYRKALLPMNLSVVFLIFLVALYVIKFRKNNNKL